MAVNFLELRNHTRTFLDESVAADWTDAQVNREINYAYMEVYTAILEVHEDYYRKIVTTNLTANETEYALPSDFHKLRRLELQYDAAETRIKATRQPFDQLSGEYNSATYGSTNRPIYEISGNNLRILPMPLVTVSNGMRLIYIKELPTLSDDADEIDIPFANRYASLIPFRSAAVLLRKGQQEEAVANKYDLRFEAEMEKMKQELKDRYNDGTAVILDTLGDNLDFGRAVVF